MEATPTRMGKMLMHFLHLHCTQCIPRVCKIGCLQPTQGKSKAQATSTPVLRQRSSRAPPVRGAETRSPRLASGPEDGGGRARPRAPPPSSPSLILVAARIFLPGEACQGPAVAGSRTSYRGGGGRRRDRGRPCGGPQRKVDDDLLLRGGGS
jgi:hypothetical protein